MSARASVSTRVLAFALVGLGIGLAACGRAATEADCQIIVDQNVKVQLGELGIDDPAVVEKKQIEIRESMQAELKDCIGRRISDRMLECVRGAKTTEEVNHCLM